MGSTAGRVNTLLAQSRLTTETEHRSEAPDGAMKNPMFTEDTMPPVSVTMQCVINLTMQYFFVYTLLAIMRTTNQFTANRFKGFQSIVETAEKTVVAAPMLSVLFLGTRMRAIQLSQGETEKYSLPPQWVQMAMYACTFAVFGQVIMVLLVTA